jgi:hypothetical protein
MKKLLKLLLLVISIITIMLVVVYLTIRFMPEKSIIKQTADFTLTATSLAEEYEINPTGSDKKFIDRIIEVKGVINEITTDQNNSIVLILRDKESTIGVLCTLREKKMKFRKHFKLGDTITLKGTCSGMLFEVVLNKCIIVDQ